MTTRAETAERDPTPDQGVGADYEVDLAGGEALERRLARRSLAAAGEEGDADAGRLGHSAPAFSRLLAGEQLSRRHQRRLMPGGDGGEHGEPGDHRLAAADVALQQAAHAARCRHVGGDLGKRLRLRAGQAEGEGPGKVAFADRLLPPRSPGLARAWHAARVYRDSASWLARSSS